MTWEWMLFLYCIGFAGTFVIVTTALFTFIRLRRELPKRPILESIEELERRKKSVEQDLEVKREELRLANNTIEYAEQQKQWLKENQHIIDDVKRLEQQFRDLDAQVAQRREENLSLEQRNLEASKAHAELDVKCSGLREEEKRCLASVEKLLAELHAVKQELDRLTVERRTAEDEVRRLTATLQQLATKNQELVKELEANKRALESELTKLREAQTRRDNLVRESERLEADIEHQHKQKELIAKQIEAFTQELGKVKPATAQDLSVRLASLWEPVLSKNDRPSKATGGEMDFLDAAKDYIKACGLVFHPRVVNALHTSLKISKESPLLVLAGISGTGKSALPRRYAEGMGMHFLNIAVQPNWDSPMDMLGFFNHLEGRYRATELARALVQMDPFHSESKRWPAPGAHFASTSDRMLLVLLDEMNLARVEYYFSDFLSRLEIRRDVNDKVETDRRKCEIGIETGGGSKDDHQMLPIYIDTNVLLVGTMNEDESTQSLSDKVIDRANVMRFGKPGELRRPSNGQLQTPRSNHLTRALWRQWIDSRQPLEPEVGKRVDDWIRQCNESMAMIGKPFAYRTSRAIQAYIQHYPDRSEVGVGHAMADQVEQRILPKLRGVDTSEGADAITGILQVVRQLKDDVLERAMESGRRDSHSFVWQGVDRNVREVVGAS